MKSKAKKPMQPGAKKLVSMSVTGNKGKTKLAFEGSDDYKLKNPTQPTAKKLVSATVSNNKGGAKLAAKGSDDFKL